MWAGWLDGNNWNCTSTTFPSRREPRPESGRPAGSNSHHSRCMMRLLPCGQGSGRSARANTPHLFLSHISTLIVCYVDEGGSYNLTQCRKSMPSLTGGRQPAIGDWRWVMREIEVEVLTRLNYLFFLFLFLRNVFGLSQGWKRSSASNWREGSTWERHEFDFLRSRITNAAI